MIYRLDVYYATKKAPDRENQDNMMIDKYVTCCSGLEKLAGHIHTDTSEKKVFAVADGAGGGYAGERASDITVHTLSSHLDYIKGSPVKTAFYKVIDRINDDVVNFYKDMGEEGASTVSGIIFDDDNVWVFNVGDSPIYLINGKEMVRLNQEHTVAAERNDGEYSGKCTRESNIITRYMGNRMSTGSEQLYIDSIPVQPGTTYVIASDGVEKGIDDKKLRKLIKKRTDDTAWNIVDKAYKSGSTDDITVIVIHVSAEEDLRG